jgi:hypothetical protein
VHCLCGFPDARPAIDHGVRGLPASVNPAALQGTSHLQSALEAFPVVTDEGGATLPESHELLFLIRAGGVVPEHRAEVAGGISGPHLATLLECRLEGDMTMDKLLPGARERAAGCCPSIAMSPGVRHSGCFTAPPSAARRSG